VPAIRRWIIAGVVGRLQVVHPLVPLLAQLLLPLLQLEHLVMALSVPPAVLPPVVLAMMEVLAARMIAPATATATVTAVASGRHPVVLQLNVAHHLALGP